MDCVFCGDELTGRPIRQEGQVYCSTDCINTAAEIGIEDDQYRMEETQENELDMDMYEETEEY